MVAVDELERECEREREEEGDATWMWDGGVSIVNNSTRTTVRNEMCEEQACNSVYRFMQCAGNRRFILWPSVVRELSTIVGIAPLLHASIGIK